MQVGFLVEELRFHMLRNSKARMSQTEKPVHCNQEAAYHNEDLEQPKGKKHFDSRTLNCVQGIIELVLG